MSPQIRTMELSDIPAIAAWMVSDSHWQTYGMTVESISSEMSSAHGRGDLLLTAQIDERPAGFAWCLPHGMFGAHPYLKRIGVDPAVTGQSVGGHLMDTLERHLAAGGARGLYLLVGSQNSRAEAFYQRRGYVMLATFPDLAVDGIEERLYHKDLSPLSY